MKFKILWFTVAAFILVAGNVTMHADETPATQPAVGLVGFTKASIYVQIAGADEDNVSYRPIRAASLTYIKDNSKFKIIDLSDARNLPGYPHILVTFGSIANPDGTHFCKAGVFVIENKKIIFQDTVTGTCSADKAAEWAKQNDLTMLKAFVSKWNAENKSLPTTTAPAD